MERTAVLVDDDPEDLEILEEAIKSVDPSVACICFSYPQEALQAVTDGLFLLPNFFFIDINMPGMTGDKLLVALRHNESLKDSVITMWSTSMSSQNAGTLKASGAAYAYQKPYKLSGYSTILQEVFKTV